MRFRSPPPLPTIFLMDGYLTKTRGGKKGQIRPMIRFRFLFSGTGDNRTRQFQRSIDISSNPVSGQLPSSRPSIRKRPRQFSERKKLQRTSVSQVTAESSSDSIARVCYRAIRDRDDLKTIHEHAHLHRNHSSQSAVPTVSLLY
jgi:hypothetical protein